jgi:hypothetical protein
MGYSIFSVKLEFEFEYIPTANKITATIKNVFCSI